MDFGKISKQELEKTDLSLKPDNIFNEKVLKNTSKIPLIKVGCPVWSVKEWNGKIYLKKVLKQSKCIGKCEDQKQSRGLISRTCLILKGCPISC